MAVPEQTPYIEHTGNGVTTSFSLKFQCESKDHLIVLVDEIEPPIATWSLTGGNVVFTTAPAAGKKITLQRNTPFSRATDYQSYNNSFRPPAVNKDFDWIWWKLQELGVADWIFGARIDALKNYVDRKDDELKAYLMEEIRKQGVALDQLDEYYNYLMQRLAQIAVDKGWDASFVVDASGENQQAINNKTIRFAETIADLLAIKKPKDGQVVKVKGFRSPIYPSTKPFQGGNTFVFDPSKISINDGVFVLNGWVAVDQELTFERCGLIVDSTDDQSVYFNNAVKYAISNKIKTINFESSGDVYFENQAIIPASKTSELEVGFNEIELNCDGVTFKGNSSASVDTLIKVHRKHVYISGSVSFVGGGSVKTAIQHGMTSDEYDFYQSNGYELLTTAFKFDNLNFKNIESGLKFIAGTQSYYHNMRKIKGDSVNYLVSFLTSPKGIHDQVTRSYIENIQHTNGVCTLYCESVETLIAPSLFSEFLRVSSGYTDTLNYVDGVPTAIYIPHVDGNGLSNNRISIKGVVEYSDLAVVNSQITNQIDIVYTNMTNGDNSIVGISTNNTDRSATTLGIKRLDVESYNFGTYPINISSSDIAANPSLKNQFPDQSWSELIGTLTFMPSTNQGFSNAYNRTELLYVRVPYEHSGLYTRTGTINASTNEKWVKLANEDRFKVGGSNVSTEGYILLFPYNIDNSDLSYFSGKLEVYRGESSVYNASCIYEIEVAQAYQSVNSFLLRKTGNSNIFPELCVVSASGQQYVAIKKSTTAAKNVFITINSSNKADYQKQVQSATYVSKLSDAVQYATSVIV